MRLVVVAALLLAAAAARPAAADAPVGGIKGTVILEGEAPDRGTDSTTDPVCQKSSRRSNAIIVTKGKLAGVAISIVGGSVLPPPPAKDKPAPVVLEQRDCEYTPRVFFLDPGQGMVVRNQDATFHNVHGTLSSTTLFNKAQPKGAPELAILAPTEGRAGDVVDITCDVHPWMRAYGVIATNPLHAVTGEDGTFEIKGLAPGKYTIRAWHPELGTTSLVVEVGRGPNKATAIARLSYKRP